MQKYYATVKAGSFALTCPACGGTFQAEHKKKGVEAATEICPHCKVKIETKYETEEDSWWDQQKIKAMESGRDQVNLRIMAGLSGQDKEDYKAGLRSLGYSDPEDKAALRDSFRRLKPNATEDQLDIMVTGETPQDSKLEWIV